MKEAQPATRGMIIGYYCIMLGGPRNRSTTLGLTREKEGESIINSLPISVSMMLEQSHAMVRVQALSHTWLRIQTHIIHIFGSLGWCG